jgi:hypothetical protein
MGSICPFFFPFLLKKQNVSHKTLTGMLTLATSLDGGYLGPGAAGIDSKWIVFINALS